MTQSEQAMTDSAQRLELVSAEYIARAICLSYGRDPDEMTDGMEMCDADGGQVPIWRVYEEQADAVLAALRSSALPETDDKCPIGLDRSPTVCSAGTCRWCRGHTQGWKDGQSASALPETGEVERLREWKAAILGKCKASDGFDALNWGGDKEGWGFVHYFIGHLETRALHAETVLAELDARPSPVREAIKKEVRRVAGTDLSRAQCTNLVDAIVAALQLSQADGREQIQVAPLIEGLKRARASVRYFRSFGSCEASCDEALAEIDTALSSLTRPQSDDANRGTE